MYLFNNQWFQRSRLQLLLRVQQMKTQLCKICGLQIGLMGWAKHVAKEKRLHGEDCYKPVQLEPRRVDRCLRDF